MEYTDDTEWLWGLGSAIGLKPNLRGVVWGKGAGVFLVGWARFWNVTCEW